MWDRCSFLGPDGKALYDDTSFAQVLKMKGNIDPAKYDTLYPHPGYAWAAQRSFLQGIGGLPDFSVVGNGDCHLAFALIGRVEESIPHQYRNDVSRGYWDVLLKLQEKVRSAQVGCVGQHIKHHWHGDVKDRQYVKRWEILVATGFNPLTDIRYHNGVLELMSGKQGLAEGLQGYFASRDEDSRKVVTVSRHAKKPSKSASHAQGVTPLAVGAQARRPSRNTAQQQGPRRHSHHDDSLDYDYDYDSGSE
eukprot:Sspe_Gene.3615::Locus_1205_Transcript_1_1_Confidence_1.000_Length_1174::g.3615::m.3615